MVQVRTCAACGRNSGPKHACCMYCGGELPALGSEAEASDAPELDPAAVAMLEMLERSSSRSASPSKPKRRSSAPSEAAAPSRRAFTPVSSEPASPKPSRITIPSLRVPRRAKKKDGFRVLPEAPSQPKTYAEALARGGGPFGNRDVQARVVLLPDPSYRPRIPWLKHRVADTLKVDLYSSIQALQRDVPRALGFFDTDSEALAAADHLRAADVRCTVLLRSFVEAWPGPREVVAVTELENDAIGFALEGGGKDAVLRSDFRLAVLGRIEPDATERAGPGTLGRSSGSYTALDLLAAGREYPFRVRSDRFDFHSMGSGMGISALVNLKRLASFLGPGGRPVPLDECFRRVPHFAALARSTEAADPPRFLRRELEFAEYVLVLSKALQDEEPDPLARPDGALVPNRSDEPQDR